MLHLVGVDDGDDRVANVLLHLLESKSKKGPHSGNGQRSGAAKVRGQERMGWRGCARAYYPTQARPTTFTYDHKRDDARLEHGACVWRERCLGPARLAAGARLLVRLGLGGGRQERGRHLRRRRRRG